MATGPSGSSSVPRGPCTDAARPGFSLVELLAALSIFAVVTALLYGALSAQVRLARATAQRVAAADAVRTASHVIAGEARRMSRADVRAAAADSIALRAFRGMAVVCGEEDGEFAVRYRGDRLPDANKDSVIVISGVAAPVAATLAAVITAPSDDCAALPGETVMKWSVDGAGDSAAVMLLFESGSYFISARALRYRRGAEGRQPLTGELFDPTASGLTATDDALITKLATGRSSPVRLVAPFAQDEP